MLPSSWLRARHGLLTCPVDPGDSHRRNRNNCLFPRKWIRRAQVAVGL